MRFLSIVLILISTFVTTLAFAGSIQIAIGRLRGPAMNSKCSLVQKLELVLANNSHNGIEAVFMRRGDENLRLENNGSGISGNGDAEHNGMTYSRFANTKAFYDILTFFDQTQTLNFTTFEVATFDSADWYSATVDYVCVYDLDSPLPYKKWWN